VKTILNNMFGFIIEQPIHITLRQMRLLPVTLLLNSQLLLWVIVDKLAEMDPTQSAMAYGTIAVTLIASIWKGFDGLIKSHDKDASNV
jgi:hypothetical protein